MSSVEARWQEINDILLAALERDDPREQVAHVEAACRGDDALCREVLSLLEVDPAVLTRIERPAVELAGRSFRDAPTGRYVGPYQILQEIGQGGMGKVYQAVHADDKVRRPVALKLLKRGLDDPNFLHRFERERQILAQLEHPAIARLLEAGRAQDRRPYLVMEHIDGEPIDRYAARRSLDVDARLELFLKVCDAVSFAHRNFVIHRDLKPSNIFVDADGEPHLLDFGIAKILEPGSLTPVSFTATGMRLMTPEYASPEQARGEAVTPASDVYALGVVLYELLTGRRPYRAAGGGEGAVRRAISDTHPERPSRARQATAEESFAKPPWRRDLDHIVLTALARDLRYRYATVETLTADLGRFLKRRPVRARLMILSRLVERFLARHRRALLGGAAAVLLLVAAGLVIVRFPGDAPDPAAAELLASAASIERDMADSPTSRASALLTLGRVARSQGHLAVSGTLLERSLALRREIHDEPHEDVANALGELALLRRLEGDLPAAELHLDELVRIRRDLANGLDLPTADAMARLAALRLARGAAGSAEHLAAPAHALLAAELPKRDIRRARAASILGGCLFARGDKDAAEPLLREGWEMLREAKNVPGIDVREAGERWVDFLETTERRTETEEVRSEIEGI